MTNFHILGLKDIIISPVFLFLTFLLAYLIAKRRYSGQPPLHTYFLAGLSLKVFGALAFVGVYQFYYNGVN